LIAVRAPFSGRSPASRLREPRGERKSKLSRTEKQEQAAAKEASSKKFADTMDAVRQFKEPRSAEKEPPGSLPSGSK
jgi:hypothetical protein